MQTQEEFLLHWHRPELKMVAETFAADAQARESPAAPSSCACKWLCGTAQLQKQLGSVVVGGNNVFC